MVNSKKYKYAFCSIFLCVLIICSISCDQKQNNSTPTAKPIVQKVVETPKPEPKVEKSKLWNDDEEFNKLLKYYVDRKNPKYNFISEFSEDYKNENAKNNKLIKERTDKIESMIGGFSDEQLKKTARAEAEKKIKRVPEIEYKKYIKSAVETYDSLVKACINRHENDYFVIGTYTSYYPIAKKALFDLRKMGICLYSKKLNSIGDGLSLSLKEHPLDPPYEGRDWYEEGKAYCYLKQFKESGHYDYSNEDAAITYIHGAILISVTLEELNEMFDAVNAKWGWKVDELFQKQNNEGGYWTRYSEMYSGGQDKYHNYSEESPEISERRRKGWVGFVRRQSIFLVAKGNPFETDIKECYLTVSGMDEKYYKKIK